MYKNHVKYSMAVGASPGEGLKKHYEFESIDQQDPDGDIIDSNKSNVNAQLAVDTELRVLNFSPNTVKLFNLGSTDIGRSLCNISTDVKFSAIIQNIKSVLLSRQVLSKEIETNKGYWYQLIIMPYIRQSDDTLIGALLTFTDITKLKEDQISLIARNKKLSRINEDLEHFVFAASHDLLAPLSNIQGSIEAMNQMMQGDQKLTDFLEAINHSVAKFSELIKDMAFIAKIDGEEQPREMVAVEELIDNIEWSLENTIKETGSTISRNLLVSHLPFSKKNLRSIIFNIVANGIKFRRNVPPEIVIASWKEGDQFAISIQDNGVGIPKGSISKVFSLYGRLNQDVGGSGIGLYLAKKMINSAGGNIVVESEVGKGSRFIIYLDASSTSGFGDLG